MLQKQERIKRGGLWMTSGVHWPSVTAGSLPRFRSILHSLKDLRSSPVSVTLDVLAPQHRLAVGISVGQRSLGALCSGPESLVGRVSCLSENTARLIKYTLPLLTVPWGCLVVKGTGGRGSGPGETRGHADPQTSRNQCFSWSRNSGR